ncbi:hypothetical protein CLV84_1940 [Neolewinella xylanilytica]|uniref:Uncharacterized protein n=1 Tax=Neolewinella xylanilytica TaxID=1514080 RepID=A0A2S6I1U2_9BACT|nr:hypothetical protein [Neolewinella xylanilytica]PPK85051.1 hypothetical protein CLV84_1940 [Neolewinella xylanilytica]
MASQKRLLGFVLLGHLYITLPALVLWLGLPLLAYLLVAPFGWWWTGLAAAAALLAGYGIAWRWWGWTVTHWRIRSFGSLDEIDWLRLEVLAERYLLTWPHGHPAEELEVRTGDQDRRIREVMERNSDLRAMEKVFFGFDTPRRYGYGLTRKSLYISLGSRLLVVIVATASLFFLPQPYIGLLLMAVVFYPSRDFHMYRHLSFRGSAIELSDAGVVLRVPKLSVHYWHDCRAYRLYEHERLLVLEGGDGAEESIDLAYYQIGDYRRLASVIDVYIERYGEKVSHSVFN